MLAACYDEYRVLSLSLWVSLQLILSLKAERGTSGFTVVIVGELLFCSGCIIYVVLLTALLNVDDTCANARMPWSKMCNLLG